MLPYKLSCQLLDHQADVRAVCCLPGVDGKRDRIVTTSRDCSAKLWAVQDESSGAYTLERTFLGHTKYVTAVCALPPSDDDPEGLIVTGSNDHKIRVFSPSLDEPIKVLTGHTGNVCTLVSGKFGTLLSGSWDGTARVWAAFDSVMELKGHTAAVWCVAIVPNSGKHLTASADGTIKIWYRGTCEQTLSQHTDCVRSLAIINANEFLSASNDGTCRKWGIDGTCDQVYRGHVAFVYSISVVPGGFVSAGEDRTARVWQDGEVVQTIPFPTQSVWSVACMSNGDFVSGSSDGVARVFTQAAERMASADELQAFDDQVQATEAASKSNQSQIGDLQLKDVQGAEVLGIPGRTDGESRLVREQGGVNAYQWDASKQEWTKIGAVENAVDNKTRGQTLDGKEYDYVFSIDVEDGKPALSLGYNRGEDPWLVAKKFLERNFLPAEYLEQVAAFITTNAGGGAAMPQGGVAQQYSDPFTGAGRYVPGSAAASNGSNGSNGASNGAGTDPFTGAGRYVPGSAGAPVGGAYSSGGAADPFTGTGRYIPGSSSLPGSSATSAASNLSQQSSAAPSMGSLTVTSNEYFPKTSPVLFEAANAAGLLKKLAEFNGTLSELLRLSDTGMSVLTDLVTRLASGTCSSMSADEKACVGQLQQWPTSHLLPGLDALRLAVRHCPADLCVGSSGLVVLNFLFENCVDVTSNVCLVALRTLCNMCSSSQGTNLLLSKIEQVLVLSQKVALEASGHQQLATCTLLLNVAVMVRPLDNLELAATVLSALTPVLEHQTLDDGAAFRLLVALGTLTCGIPETQAVADSLAMQAAVARFTSSQTAKVKDCANLVLGILP